ncbi:glutathione-disulfide reductase [Marinicella gelatinilytica]|uniref:glutathione-disulfide reductase n=1 Tax=Marinicella gelatinilytica TaxID=2996017 RepID=UPI002260CFA1|nr:glutathione-disulfide reductase [Marinicella gelatinilytica]MCX7545245.1 glutathione-disulfide reductase [Marinicella gelatinilytica]
MTQYDYDLIVIGGGSGGVRAARIAGGYGKKVALCEADKLGGTCVIRGCVPKKLMVYAAGYQKMFKAAKAFGWEVDSHFDWPTLLKNKDEEVHRLNQIYHNLINNAGVTLHPHFASFVDQHTIQVGDKTITGKHIIIATGGLPQMPDIPGVEYVINSNQALDLPELPQSMVIYGGGYIAVEFAGIFNALGVAVKLVYRGPQLLRGFDDEVAKFAQQSFSESGIEVITNTSLKAIEKTSKGYQCVTDDGNVIDSDCVFFATGRVPNIQGLNLDKIGVDTEDDGRIRVNDHQATNVDHIFAVGDVSNIDQLTPVAIKEGHLLVDRLFKDSERLMEYDNIASTVFSMPEIGRCGLTEAEASEQYKNVKCYTSTFRAMKYAMSEVTEKTFMKVIVCEDSDKVLGIHIVGTDAGEIIQGFAVAIKQGLTRRQLQKTIGIHPTSAEELVTL